LHRRTGAHLPPHGAGSGHCRFSFPGKKAALLIYAGKNAAYWPFTRSGPNRLHCPLHELQKRNANGFSDGIAYSQSSPARKAHPIVAVA
jgi:hypothetical protein